MTPTKCPDCKGRRLKPEALSVTVSGRPIDRVVALQLKDAQAFFQTIALTEREEQIAGKILKEVRDRLGFLNAVGVGYLMLDRNAATLSGGEAQRIRLATADRLETDGRSVRARRAVDRTATSATTAS